jgi:hypothetical protein
MIGAGGLSDVDSGKNDVPQRIAETLACDIKFLSLFCYRHLIFELFKDLVAECMPLFKHYLFFLLYTVL